MNAAIQRLRAEVSSDRRTFEARVEELGALTLDSEASAAVLAQAAVALHHAYSAVEAALERVARTLEGGTPEGPASHQALLEAMALDIEGVRPAIVSAQSIALLRRLLGFRHFFRHAYAATWDAAQLADLRQKAIALRPLLAADFDRLDALLARLATHD